MFSKESKKHLNDVKMTRFQHFKFAYGILIELKKAELALIIHMIIPKYFETYASNKIKLLANKL